MLDFLETNEDLTDPLADLPGSGTGVYPDQADWRWRRQPDRSGPPLPPLVRDPDQTGGGGDNLTGVGLLYHLL